MKHSKIVGGSTAKRVIHCPGSVGLVAQMPPQVASKYAAEGTLLHECIEAVMAYGTVSTIAAKYNLTDEQTEKLRFCAQALDEIDPKADMRFVTETQVEFEGVKELEGVFGNADLVGRIGDRCIVLDWKFGDGVMVEAEESYQGLFYAAATKKTSSLYWAAQGTSEVEIVIVQPPHVRRWVTTWNRVDAFERELVAAVKLAQRPDAPTAVGDWCRWCTAKPVCPSMTGAIDRTVHQALKDIDNETLGAALQRAESLETFIKAARALAQARLKKGMSVPGYKLVAKRATRQWANDLDATESLRAAGLVDSDIMSLSTPAQVEEVCKKLGVDFPTDQVVSVSSGNTMAPESDKRPAVLVLGEQLRAALNRVQ